MPRAPKSCANPLFYAWVQEFHDEKDYRKRGGPPRATGYENALRSIEACTTKYAHPKELLVLNGVGPTCVERLMEKLEEHCARRGIDMPEFKKKERAKKTPVVAPKKAARRPKGKGRVDEDEDSDAEFEAPKKSRARGSDDDDEYEGNAHKENVGTKRRVVPARGSTVKRAAALAPESDEDEED